MNWSKSWLAGSNPSSLLCSHSCDPSYNVLVGGNLCIHNTLHFRRGGRRRVPDRAKEESETLKVGTSGSSTSSNKLATMWCETGFKDR